MARVGASFVYTPTSESIRGGGISPFANAHRAGVNVALGTDGPMVDYSVDMVEQMKACALMQHVRHLDPTRMPVERTLEMATINAAKALGLEHEIGSLEAGKRADIAVFDLDQALCGRAAPAAVEPSSAPARAAMRAPCWSTARSSTATGSSPVWPTSPG